ncbi:MAG TPA: glycosyltransferase [Algoriphagus sp.]|nr:glycosyltransferase [Algoriphagus sp.]
MRKIILVSYYFSPCTLTPAQRITYWAQNFHRFGFYPIVVTRAWNKDLKTHLDTKVPFGEKIEVQKFPNFEVHYLPFKPGILDWSYKRFGEGKLRPIFLLTKLLDVLMAQFTLAFTSYSNFLPHLQELIREGNPGKILISGEPFYLFRLGYKLRRIFGISWVADYRDDWSTNELQMEKGGSRIRKWVAKIESNYEKKWVGTADSVISVSEAYTRRISDFLRKPGITIQNGFEEALLDLPDSQLYDQFTVMYSGILYPSQDIRLILEVMDKCLEQNRPFRLVFLGAGFDVKEKKRIEALVPNHLKSFVDVTDRFPRNQALEMLQKAHVLLGMAYGDMKGIPSSKLYEYVALGKPVLLCPTDGDVMEAILKETGLGFFADNIFQSGTIIRELQDSYMREKFRCQFKERSREKVKGYSRFHQLEKLAQYLEK